MRWTLMISTLLVSPAFLLAQPPSRTLNELKAFYAANCVRCHGADGSAHAPEGKKLGGFDFTDAKNLAKETDATMVKTIRKGIFFGVVMPPFKERISEADAQVLVQEVLRKTQKGKVIAPGE